MYKVAFDKEGKLQQGKEDMQLRRKSGKKKAIDPRVARAKLVLQAIERSDMESIAVSREPVSISASFAQLGRPQMPCLRLSVSAGRRYFCATWAV